MSDLDPKDPNVPAQYTIDWHDDLIAQPLREFDFEAGIVIQAQIETGWYYESTSAGRTPRNYPIAWPRAEGEEVQDGSVVWTARHPSSAIVPQVSSAAWTLPSGITKDSQVESGSLTHVVLSGGTDGEDYEILCRMTPTSGLVREKTIIVKVRSQ